jgi:hypothetical protein
MIQGRLVPVAGPQVKLKTSTFSLWEGFDVGVRAGRDAIEISRGGVGAKRQPPIIKIELKAEFLLSLIGKGRYHKPRETFVFGVELHQDRLGSVDLVGGIDAQRDGPDRHQLQSVDFSYFEDEGSEGPRGFILLFDLVYGDGVAGQGRNGWTSHADVTGHRKWVRCDARWSELYQFHEWAIREESSLPGDVLRERLGVDIARPDRQSLG